QPWMPTTTTLAESNGIAWGGACTNDASPSHMRKCRWIRSRCSRDCEQATTCVPCRAYWSQSQPSPPPSPSKVSPECRPNSSTRGIHRPGRLYRYFAICSNQAREYGSGVGPRPAFGGKRNASAWYNCWATSGVRSIQRGGSGIVTVSFVHNRGLLKCVAGITSVLARSPKNSRMAAGLPRPNGRNNQDRKAGQAESTPPQPCPKRGGSKTLFPLPASGRGSGGSVFLRC